MSAYVILQIDVTNPALFEEYKKLSPAALAACGGKYLVRGGKVETLEGDWSPARVVVLEFESVEKAKAWLQSPEYAPAWAIRKQAAITQSIVVEGV